LLKLLETEKWYYPLLSNNGKFLLESVLKKIYQGSCATSLLRKNCEIVEKREVYSKVRDGLVGCEPYLDS